MAKSLKQIKFKAFIFYLVIYLYQRITQIKEHKFNRNKTNAAKYT